MTTCKVGIVAVVVLLAAGIGIGIAQAAGTYWERPVLNFEDMAAAEQGGSSCCSTEDRPVLSFEDREAINVAKSSTEDVQLQNPIETGSLPAESSADLDPFSRSGP
jgi:hypothetical protein